MTSTQNYAANARQQTMGIVTPWLSNWPIASHAMYNRQRRFSKRVPLLLEWLVLSPSGESDRGVPRDVGADRARLLPSSG